MSLTPYFVDGGSSPLAHAAVESWWIGLQDPLLDELVSRGLAQNLDIRSARQRIRRAEASVGRTGLAAQISGGLSASAERERDSDGDINNRSALTASAAYVFDLFGGFRRGNERARASLDAARFDEGTVRLAYLSDIVDAYIKARYFQNTAWITRQAIQSRRATLNAVTRQLSVGVATRLDVAQAEAQLRTAEATLATLQANFETNVFRIATLLAEPAPPILARMESGARQPVPMPGTGTGTPADLLRNRPDIRAAERDLAAATAAIGVAEAALYPSLRLSGFVTEAEENTWSFGPMLSLPVLNRGVLTANRDEAVAEAAEAELAWRSEVLAAVEEVQSARSFTSYWRRQVAAQRAAAASTEEAYALSQRSFETGDILFSDLLDAERRALESRMALAAGLRDLATSWLRLQVATGRGWMAGTEQPSEPGG
jgi:multidrug efflux system outer membrane protein